MAGFREIRSFEVVGKENDWSMADEGELKGVKIGIDRLNGEIVALSTRHCRDENRWTSMPSLEKYPELKELDLHKMRYIQKVHPSLCALKNLDTLVLTRCERLTSLPEDFGGLLNLRQVRKTKLSVLVLFLLNPCLLYQYVQPFVEFKSCPTNFNLSMETASCSLIWLTAPR